MKVMSISPGIGGIGPHRMQALVDAEITYFDLTSRDSVAAAIGSAKPSVVHLHAEPHNAFARQIAFLCRRHDVGLLLETDAIKVDTFIAARRARATLSHVHSAVCRSAHALATLRRLGLRGLGVIAAAERPAHQAVDRGKARQQLKIPPARRLVIGWSATDTAMAPANDLLDALAIGDGNALAVIDAGVLDEAIAERAEALDVLDAVRTVHGAARDVTGLLNVIDVLVILPGRSQAARRSALSQATAALTGGIPVIHPPYPELCDLVGRAGWAVPERDPTLLARLLSELNAEPALLAAAAAAAAHQHSPTIAAEQFARAMHAAADRYREASSNGQIASAVKLRWPALARRP